MLTEILLCRPKLEYGIQMYLSFFFPNWEYYCSEDELKNMFQGFWNSSQWSFLYSFERTSVEFKNWPQVALYWYQRAWPESTSKVYEECHVYIFAGELTASVHALDINVQNKNLPFRYHRCSHLFVFHLLPLMSKFAGSLLTLRILKMKREDHLEG